MIKRIAYLCVMILMVLPLTGCWDYIPISQITIVSGITIDKDQASNEYQLAFEIYDVKSSSKDEGVKPKIIDSTGTTIFEAIRNAKSKLSNKLYFGAAQVIVVNESIAKEGMKPIIDFFLRDKELRETTKLVISQEKSAKDILTSEYTDEKIISTQIDSIITENAKVTLSTVNSSLYQTYNILKSEEISLVLPAFKNNKKNNITITEANGIAIFKEDKLKGYLFPEETKYYSFVVNEVEGGVLAFENINSDIKKISLEIVSNKTRLSYTYTDNKIKMIVEPKVNVHLGEIEGYFNSTDEKQIQKLEETTGMLLGENISSVIKKVQTKYQTDIFGFGSYINKKKPKLWNKLSSNWNEIFSNLEVEVKPKIVIKNTSQIR